MFTIVIGCGSIGKRHIRNLDALQAGRIIAHDVQAARRQEVEKEFGIRAYERLDEALAQKPDAAFVCTPSAFHISPALAAAKAGCHLFIEKPLSHTMDGIEELIGVVEKKDLITMVGCNMRFHPAIAQIKKLLEAGAIGKVLSARVQTGQYLPDWHPAEDYRKGYSANKLLGGGIILDGIHEIDYITWFLGEVKDVFCFAGKLSSLEIDTEDTAEVLVRFDSQAIIEIHLDYVQHPYGRSCHLIGEEGTITWNFKEPVKLYSVKTKTWQSFPEPAGYDTNRMYIDELKHFIRCLKTRTKPAQDIGVAKRNLEIALAAKKSAETGRVISLQHDG